MLEYGDLEMGHARAMLALEPEMQIAAAQEVAGKGLSVRQAEALVKKLQQGDTAEEKPKPEANPRLDELAGELSLRFSTKVAISENARGGVRSRSVTMTVKR